MKHLFLGIALLLAAIAAAQTKTGNWPVMRMSNPSQYLEIKPRTAPPADPAPAEQPPRKFDIDYVELKPRTAPPAGPAPAEQPPRKFDADTPSADEKSLQSEYLLYLEALEARNPDLYLEELEYIYRYKGEKPLTEEQLKYLLRLLELRPEYGGGYNTLGYNYMALQEMDKAKAAFEKYLELAPNEPNAYDSMGEYYLNTGDYARSAEYYDRAVALGMEGSKKGAEKARAAMEHGGN